MALRKEDQGLESVEPTLEGAKSDQTSVKTERNAAGRETGQSKQAQAKRTAVGEGTAPLTITNSRGFTVPAIRGKNGGLLAPANRLGDTNPNAGAPKKLTRESLTDAAGEAAESYRELRDKWLELAKQALESGDTGEADRCQKAADRIQGAYLQYGVGSKVTHVIDKPEWVAQTGRAFDWAADSLGIDPQDAARLRKLMFKRIDESLE